MSRMGREYKAAGVDTVAADTLIKRIAPFCKATARPEVIAADNGFAGLFRMPQGYKDAVFVSSTDGVGTKLKLACATGRHATIGRDLVAMCVNDILVNGAEPLWFLDYFATGALDLGVAETVIKGVADACADAGCALLGGETAEMPGVYAKGEYDLAGFAVGVVERNALLGAQRVRCGDAVLGLASSGVHSNGFSLVRRIVADAGLDWDAAAPWGGEDTLGAQLLTPTKIYVKPVLELVSQGGVHAMAHITGGGLTGNIPRVLQPDQDALIRADAWPRPGVFDWLASAGDIDADGMLEVFNCGVGMVLIVAPDTARAASDTLRAAGLDAWPIGEVVAGGRRVVYERG